MVSTWARLRLCDSLSEAARAAGSASRARAKSSGSTTTRGSVSSSTSTSTSSPIETPAARRLALLRPSRLRPRMMATRLLHECPLIVMDTAGRLPRPAFGGRQPSSDSEQVLDTTVTHRFVDGGGFVYHAVTARHPRTERLILHGGARVVVGMARRLGATSLEPEGHHVRGWFQRHEIIVYRSRRRRVPVARRELLTLVPETTPDVLIPQVRRPRDRRARPGRTQLG